MVTSTGGFIKDVNMDKKELARLITQGAVQELITGLAQKQINSIDGKNQEDASIGNEKSLSMSP